MLAVDTETTGLDLRHGARPFFVTMCRVGEDPVFWEWDVDPLTRQPTIPQEDIEEIEEWLNTEDELVLQNPKFDAAALATIGIQLPWSKVKDTLLAGHLLASNQPHDLTTMTLVYLGVNIKKYEDALQEVCNAARRLARSKFPTWRIAKEGLPEMPSAKGGSKKGAKGVESESPWKFDCWLPRAIAKHCKYSKDHPWWTVLQEYANTDSVSTAHLWPAMLHKLTHRKLYPIYEERLKLLPIVARMEANGVTLSATRLDELVAEYKEESSNAGSIVVNLAAAKGYALDLPKGASPNNSLRRFCFDVLDLPRVYNKKAKSTEPTLNKEAMEQYLATLPKSSIGYSFIKNLTDKRSRDTALSYMEGYRRFWKSINGSPRCDWFRLFPSLNPTGTDTLRFSSSNPNEQNISKKKGFNLRYCFGPAPGREWWSLDAQNIELRIPAYEAGEQDFIALFERPNDPPYFGSNHLLIAHLLFPREFDECIRNGWDFKEKYKSTLYQRTKNGNFAVQYGAVDKADGTGTADRTYGLPGAQARIKARFAKQEAHNQWCIDFARKHGYIETVPDKTVDPYRGYPLLCARTDYGDIKPTVPLNYRTQGTAMWWMSKAMVRCQPQLDEWNAADPATDGSDNYFIVMQVHDELVFDFPKRAHPLKNPKGSNLQRIRIVKQLMERGGDDIGIPTPVSIGYNEEHWADEVKVTV